MADLVTLNEVKSHLGAENAARDSYLNNWIAGVSEQVRRMVSPIETTNYADEAYDGEGVNSLMLDHRPVTEVTAVKVNGEETESTYTCTEYGLLRLAMGVFPTGAQNVTVTYKAGYGANVPADLKLAVLGVLEAAARAGTLGRSGAVDADFIFSFDRWPKWCRNILQTYRRPY
jgi:hypothetical protein